MSEPHNDTPRQGSGLALATWSLFVGLALLMVAGGLFGTLLGVRSERVGLPTAVSSLISASYFVGFLVGSRLTLSGLGRVGHIRVYAALASTLAATIIAVGITNNAPSWALLRFASGVCTAGVYVVAESWLNDLASNANRGRLMAVYSVVTIAFFGAGQVLVSAFDARAVTGYALAAILTSLAVAPVSLSEEAVAPNLDEAEHLSLRELARMVPSGVGSCVLIGVAHGAMGGMVAIYATRVGLSAAQIGLCVALPSVGGVLLQWPIAAASDDLDRRAVGVATAAGAAGVAALLLLGAPDAFMAFVLMTLLGGLSWPLYSIASSYTNDWIEPQYVNAAASQMVTLYGMGAVVGPFVAAGSMIVIGAEGFLWSLVGLHALVALFFLYRMVVWRAPLAKRPWSEVSLPARAFFVPATIIAITRRARRRTG